MKKFIFLCLTSIIILSSSQAPVALGCTMSPGDRWFSVKPEITNNPLSSLLEISFSEDNTLVTFTNRGLASDLYIASKDTDGQYPGYRDAQKEYRPAEKIIGHEFEPNILVSAGDGLPKGVYEFNGGWDTADSGGMSDENSGTAILDAVLDKTDNYKTKQIIGDDRPDTVSIPTPDAQTMYAFYQGKRYNIEIVLNYSLNKSYNPNLTKDPCSNETGALRISNWLTPPAILALASLIFIVFILSLWLYVRSVKKNRSNQSLPKSKTRK